jgi:hypothetical protein
LGCFNLGRANEVTGSALCLYPNGLNLMLAGPNFIIEPNDFRVKSIDLSSSFGDRSF